MTFHRKTQLQMRKQKMEHEQVWHAPDPITDKPLCGAYGNVTENPLYFTCERCIAILAAKNEEKRHV